MASRMNGLPNLVRIPRNDEEGFVLINVSAAGRGQLDLKLIGTEGENVFSTAVTGSQTSKLKTQSINQVHWDELLLAFLLGILPDDGRHIPEDVEATATVDEAAITIMIQKKVEGITSRYGAIALSVTEEEVSIFDWCGLTVQTRDQSRDESRRLKAQLQSKDAQIKKLEAGLNDLVELKTKNEKQLLEKFSLLLNEKKLKIRDQQRLLATSTVDRAKVETAEVFKSTDATRSSRASRKGKRKAVTAVIDDDSDSGFEKMDVDMMVDDTAKQSDADIQTPDASTAADTETDDDPQPAPPLARTSTRKSRSPNLESPLRAEDEIAIPPKRDLPFSKKAEAPTKPLPIPAKPANGSETESEDDEL